MEIQKISELLANAGRRVSEALARIFRIHQSEQQSPPPLSDLPPEAGPRESWTNTILDQEEAYNEAQRAARDLSRRDRSTRQ